MPKAVVQYPSTDGFSGTEMSVHWSKEIDGGYVQIGLTRHVWGALDPDAQVKPIHADHSACSECAVAVRDRPQRPEGQPQMMRADFTDAPPVGEFDDPATVFTEQMTRSEINRLIRALREARDQAYGKDA